jgi:hypothetical protein
VPRQLIKRVVEAKVAESLGAETQWVTGTPWVLPTGLSGEGRVLDHDLLSHFGYTADPRNEAREYA